MMATRFYSLGIDQEAKALLPISTTFFAHIDKQLHSPSIMRNGEHHFFQVKMC